MSFSVVFKRLSVLAAQAVTKIPECLVKRAHVAPSTPARQRFWPGLALPVE